MLNKTRYNFIVILTIVLLASGAAYPLFGVSKSIDTSLKTTIEESTTLNQIIESSSIKEKNPLDEMRSSKGMNLFVGGIGPGNYSTIQEAINNANDGDTIFVYTGIYSENIVINKSVELIGENKFSTIIDGSNIGITVTIERDNVNISTFTIRNGDVYGLLMDNVKWCTINNSILSNNNGTGLYARSSINNTIHNSTFSNNEYGIYCDHYSRDCTIKNNVIENNEFRGIFIKSSSNNVIRSNEITSNEVGIALFYATDNALLYNTLENNDQGFRIKSSSENSIRYNDIITNDIGIYIFYDSTFNWIVGNNLSSNQNYSIQIDKIMNPSNTNIIYHNNFETGSGNQSVFDDCTNRWYSYSSLINGGNYWSEFDQPGEGAWDNDSDFIIDDPYNITGGENSDIYPLLYPWYQVVPTADFNWSPLSISTSDLIHFTDQSTDAHYGVIMNWSWDFGDGLGSSYNQHPMYSYGDDGTYSVSLLVTDDDGGTAFVAYNITVGNAPPVADFTWSPVNPSTSDVISFMDTSTDSDGVIVNWSWDFGDGLGSSYIQHPMYSYGDDGTYYVELVVTDDDGLTDSHIFPMSIGNDVPVADFIWNPAYPSTTDNVQFIDLSNDTDGTIVSWSWDFGDGLGSSTIRHPIYSYDDDGTYSVSLLVTDDDGGTAFVAYNITVGNAPPVADFTWSPVNPSTSDVISFMDTSTDSDGVIVNWSWDFGDGLGSSYNQHPMYSYDDDGLYSVNLTVRDNDDITDSFSYNINITNVAPLAIGDIVVLNEDSSVDINVTTNDLDTDGVLNLSSVVIVSDVTHGNTTVSSQGIVTYTPDLGFTGLDQFTYTIQDDDHAVSNVAVVNLTILDVTPPIAAFSYTPMSPSTADIIQFTDESTDNGVIISWSWDFGDGMGYSSIQNPTYSYADNGTYSVMLIVTDDENATDTIQHNITVTNTPPIAINDIGYLIKDSTLEVNVTTNDYDTDGVLNLSSVVIVSDVTHGNTTVSSQGIVTYTPDLGFTGLDQFTYTIQDDDQENSNTATVELHVILSGGHVLDQQQAQNGYGFMVFGSRWGAQSFIPTTDSLSKIDLLLQKRGNPSNPIQLLIRSSLSGENIMNLSLSNESISTTEEWIAFDFPNIEVTPLEPYYILVYTQGGDSRNCYTWKFGYNTAYTNGSFHFSSTTGSTWVEYPMYDFCFETYSPISTPYPSLAFNPTSFDFGSMLENQIRTTSFDVWNGGIGVLDYSINETCSWLTVSPTTGSSTGELDPIQIEINTSYLPVGLYHYDIPINSNGGDSTFGVDLEILPSNPDLLITPHTYDFGEIFIDEIDTTNFTITNNGTGTLTYSISETCSWIDISPTTGQSIGENDTILVTIDTTGLSEGVYHCDIDILSNGGNDTFGVDVEVITPIPVLSYSPQSYDFGDINSNTSGNTTFYIWNGGNGTLSYSCTETCDWLSVLPTSGSSNGEADAINIYVDTSGLAEGSYQYDINILSNGGNAIFTVYMTIVGPIPQLSMTPSYYDFGAQYINETSSMNLEIWNSGEGVLTYSISESCTWLTITPLSGTSTGEHDLIDLTVNTTGLSDGVYNCTISITSNGGQENFEVYMQVVSAGLLPDQSQEQDGYQFMIFGTRWAAQSFRPGISILSKIDVLLAQRGLHLQNLTFGIRETLSSPDIVTIEIPSSTISQTLEWVEIDIDDINVTIGEEYYIVLHTEGGTSTNCYIWGFGYNTPYTTGVFHFSSSNGNTWLEYIAYDYCFRTYGPAGPQIPVLCHNPSVYDFGTLAPDQIESTDFEIWNCGSGTLTYVLNESCDWLSLSTLYGDSTGEQDQITAEINTENLSEGQYECNVSITSNGGNATIHLFVYVSSAQPILAFSPQNYDFGEMQSGDTASASFDIWNNGTGNLTYTIVEYSSWLGVSPLYGSSTGEHDAISLWLNTAGLSEGVYSYDINLNSNGGNDVFTVSFEIVSELGIDQEQTQDGYNFMTFGDRWAAQSFIPTVTSVSSVDLLLLKRGDISGGLTISIYEDLSEKDLTSLTIPSESITASAQWINIDLPNINVSVGEPYYIVIHTSGGSSSNCYLWSFGYNTAYTNGIFEFSTNAGDSWLEYPMYDFCFRTYG